MISGHSSMNTMNNPSNDVQSSWGTGRVRPSSFTVFKTTCVYDLATPSRVNTVLVKSSKSARSLTLASTIESQSPVTS